jgi:hypothetical protein
MKSLKSYINVTLVAVLFFAAASCGLFDQDSRVYDGPDQVEFFPLSATVDDGAGTLDVDVQLIGEQRSSDVDISYVVVDSLTDAVEGTHYTLNTPSPVTISANSSETQVEITVEDAGMASGEFAILTLALEDNSGANIKAAENLRFFELTIRGQ